MKGKDELPSECLRVNEFMNELVKVERTEGRNKSGLKKKKQTKNE